MCVRMFTAIIAQLQERARQIEANQQEARERILWLRRVIQEIADDTEAKGSAWASERAKRALSSSMVRKIDCQMWDCPELVERQAMWDE